MTRLYISLLIFLCSASCSASEFPLIGSWKSNEGLTLSSMSKISGIPEKAKLELESGIFGKLILDFNSKNEVKSYIPGETDDIEEFNSYQKFQILEQNEEYIELKQYNEILDQTMIKKFYFEGDCFYVFVTKWKFKEYFCKFITSASN